LKKEGEFVFNFSGESVVGLIEISGHQKSLSSPEEFSSGSMPSTIKPITFSPEAQPKVR